ncbi:hypothetical protein FNV43_RR05683 [Rhamnella rubrinervis]|uniref:Protein kinase domain-containing protein n=1 Tax=Rhamnella rubrinervis TaxID=2594499 RepID=A0A8K0HP90_9ROSA|nr:hypothetical protein FNV43_RR05683 [Rhamnella rubrinervis]
MITFLLELGAGQNQCEEVQWCGDQDIRFPFRLKGRQPEHCGYPGFELSCNTRHETVLELPTAKFLVSWIDYESQAIELYNSDDCLVTNIQLLNTTAFHFYNEYNMFAFLNCSSTLERTQRSNNKENNIGCRMKIRNGSRGSETECYIHQVIKGQNESTKTLASGVCVGAFIIIVVIIIAYRVYSTNKLEKENQLRVERFLEDYKALKPSRYSYADIKRITDQFKEKLGQGAYGTVFKGNLSSDCSVAVKILNSMKGDGEDFINEVSTMGRIHHVNVTRLVGFCADGFHRGLVYQFLTNGSLQKYISLPDTKYFLGWEKLEEIALGIAQGIEYLHQGCDQQILHFDIKPHNILLDHNFTPKISDFGMAKLCSKDQSMVSMNTARGTMGYIAPEVFSRNFGKASYKSDVYSFGMLLLEMVGGRKINTDVTAEENTSEVYYPEWIYNLLDEGEDLRIHIEKEGDAKIAKKLAIVGLSCIQWYPVNRPSMKVAVQMLEAGEGLSVPSNPFASIADPTKTTTRSLAANRMKPELEAIAELE